MGGINMHSKYDLVKVIDKDDREFYGALGIINEVDKDIDGYTLYGLLFVGSHHNRLAERETPLFYGDELEGI